MIAYGLAVEHTLEDLTLWDGERGQVYLYVILSFGSLCDCSEFFTTNKHTHTHSYQSELAYGVDQASFGDKYVVFENINRMSQRISIECRRHRPTRHSKKNRRSNTNPIVTKTQKHQRSNTGTTWDIVWVPTSPLTMHMVLVCINSFEIMLSLYRVGFKFPMLWYLPLCPHLQYF